MSSYTVRVKYLESGSGYTAYVFPLVQSVSDPVQGMKATEIKGVRGDGSVVIPGGKQSMNIELEGMFYDDDYDFKAITDAMAAMQTAIGTDTGTLTMEYYSGGVWVPVWAYTVRRINEITFPPSLRINSQTYRVSFLVMSY